MEGSKTDWEQELFRLFEERDHLNIQISFLGDAQGPQAEKLKALNQQLELVNISIARRRPSERY
jgi:hypothetical protein